METIHSNIEKKLERRKRGQLFFLSDFRGLGSDAAIRQSISRLSKEKKIKRVAQGIYVVPIIDPVLGELMPSMESIAEAIAKKDHVRIKPAGAYALHKLGITTQIPMKLVYVTDGAPKQIKIGKATIKFKPTTSKKLAMEGELSSLIIQALEEIGTENLDLKTVERIKDLLFKEDSRKLMRDIKLAPARISDFLFSLLKNEPHDRMVKAK